MTNLTIPRIKIIRPILEPQLPVRVIEVPKVMIAISGSGSNGIRITENMLEKQEATGNAPYKVVGFFSDNPNSNCARIVSEFREKRGLKLENLIFDIKAFYKRRKEPLRNMDVRREYDNMVASFFEEIGVDILCLAGYMKTVTDVFTDYFLVLNVHPADLRVSDKNGKRKYTGDKAVRAAILDGANELRSSVHIVEYDHDDPTHLLDAGALIGVSAGYEPVVLPAGFNYTNPEWVAANSGLIDRISGEHQDRLKKVGDLVAYPAGLELVASGRVTMDYRVAKDKRIIHIDGKTSPNGIFLAV